LPFANVRHAALLTDNLDRGKRRGLNSPDTGNVLAGRDPPRFFKPDARAFDLQGIEPLQRRDETARVGVDDFANQWQEAGERVLGREPSGLETRMKILV
jgi:hypothetical protein